MSSAEVVERRHTLVSPARANVLGLFVAVAAIGVVLAAFAIVWGAAATARLLDAAFGMNAFVFFGVLFASVVAHELLHGVAFRAFAGIPWREVRFGVFWRWLTPYATTASPMTATAYRGTCALPGIVTGVLPAMLGVATGTGGLTAYGALMLAGAGGDVIALWIARDIPGSAIVRDSPTNIGCEVVA